MERAQQEKNAAVANFNAHQQADNRATGAYPRLPQQQTGYGGPPPYTPSASGGGYTTAGQRTSYNQGYVPRPSAAGTAGPWGGTVGGGTTNPYGGYAGGHGSQLPNTQRR